MAEQRENKTMIDPKLMDLHTTVFSQIFSPCGTYLAACNNFGHICVFSITSALGIAANEESKQPINKFKGSNYETEFVRLVFLLSIIGQFVAQGMVLSGSTDGIYGWKWKDVIHCKDPRPAWSLANSSKNILDCQETNAMAINKSDNTLISGCGDNNVYVWDLESGERKATLSGHTDYVHCVSYLSKTSQCVSGSEDGTVCCWDYRCPGEPHRIIKPYENTEIARRDFGKYISCLAVDEDEDWMVCGGGPTLSLWYLKSVSMTVSMPTPDAVPQSALFVDDMIVTGGSESVVRQWSLNGTERSRYPCSPRSVYSLIVNSQSEKSKVLAIAGSSSAVDIATNHNYVAFSLAFRN